MGQQALLITPQGETIELIPDVLVRNLELRQAADYGREHVTETQALRALQRTRSFLTAVLKPGDEMP